MKNSVILTTFLLFLLTLGFPKPILADEVFDRYESNISWNEQRAHLDNFAYHLQTNVKDVGYIVFYMGEKDSLKKLKSRVDRSIKYLIQNGKIEKRRLIIIKAVRKQGKSDIILQPVSKNLPPPNFN